MEPAERTALFVELRLLLQPYTERFKVDDTKPGNYSLCLKHPIEAFGKRREDFYVMGLREGKDMISFHYMPLYTDTELLEKLPESWRKILKGKTCFNVKKLTSEMKVDFPILVDAGLEKFRGRGWA